MKKSFSCFFAVFLFLLFTNADAALVNNGETITDTDTGLTWAKDANLFGATMTWNNAVAWAENLDYAGYDDWRLPYSDISCSGSGCAGSELGHLFYVEGVASLTPGIFTNVQSYMYWSFMEDSLNTSNAFRFSMRYGTQGTSAKDDTRYAWAVRDATPVAPEPISSVLFIIGGGVLAVRKFIKK